MLNTQRIYPYTDWCNDMYDGWHDDPTYRWKDAVYMKRFQDTIHNVKHMFAGVITHYSKGPLFNIRYMMYAEGTPIFHFFKFVPKDYFIYTHEPDDLWKKHAIDENILSFFSANGLNKYESPNESFSIHYEYILVPLQYHYDQLEMIRMITDWARENKKHVIFKKHPFVNDRGKDFIGYFKNNFHNDYVVLTTAGNTNDLVRNCKMVWTDDSGVGLNALIQKKPVSYFKKTYDFTYGPIAKYCKTPEEAHNNPGTDDEDLLRYLSWYYHRFIVDMKSPEAEDKIVERLDLVFNKDYDARKLFG